MAGALSASDADGTSRRGHIETAARYPVKNHVHMNGHANGATVVNGSANGVANHSNGADHHDDSDDEEFHVAVPISRGSSASDDFFDAKDGLEEYMSSDDDSPHKGRSRPAARGRRSPNPELVARLQEETRRRTAAEEDLAANQSRIESMETLISQVTAKLQQGSLILSETWPCDENVTGDTNTLTTAEHDSPLIKALTDAVTRGSAIEAAAKERDQIMARKEVEMSRLRDKLLYWERMNHEMSEKNNEAVEHIRAHRRRWEAVWKAVGIGAAVVLGVGTIAAIGQYSGLQGMEETSNSSSSGSGSETAEGYHDS